MVLKPKENCLAVVNAPIYKKQEQNKRKQEQDETRHPAKVARTNFTSRARARFNGVAYFRPCPPALPTAGEKFPVPFFALPRRFARAFFSICFLRRSRVPRKWRRMDGRFLVPPPSLFSLGAVHDFFLLWPPPIFLSYAAEQISVSPRHFSPPTDQKLVFFSVYAAILPTTFFFFSLPENNWYFRGVCNSPTTVRVPNRSRSFFFLSDLRVSRS